MSTEVTIDRGRTVVPTRYYGGTARGAVADVYMTEDQYRAAQGRRVRIDDVASGQTVAQAMAGRAIRFVASARY